MSDGYWQGNLVSDATAPHDAAAVPKAHGGANGGAPAFASPPFGQASGSIPFGADASALEPSAPEKPEAYSQGSSPYWRGDYYQQDAEDAAEPVMQQAGTVSARARRAYAAEALRQKDHVAAGLLAIFLGVFGVHKFYLGCNQAGFLTLAVSVIGSLFTFGLAAAVIIVISIIEGVIYLTKSQTEFDQIYVLNQRDWF